MINEIKIMKKIVTDLGFIVTKNSRSNIITITDKGNVTQRVIYFKNRNSENGFWGPTKVGITQLLSNTNADLMLISENDVYVLDQVGISKIPDIFSLNKNNQYLINELQLTQKIKNGIVKL